MLPHIILFEPLSECMVIGGCTAWAVSTLFKWDALAFYLIHILAWFMCDWVLLSVVQVFKKRIKNIYAYIYIHIITYI